MSDLVELRKKVKELRAKQVPVTKATLEDLQREIKAEEDLAKLAAKRANMAALREAKLKAKKEGPAAPKPKAVKAVKAEKVPKTPKASMPLASIASIASDTDEAPVHMTVNVEKKKKKVVE